MYDNIKLHNELKVGIKPLLYIYHVPESLVFRCVKSLITCFLTFWSTSGSLQTLITTFKFLFFILIRLCWLCHGYYIDYVQCDLGVTNK